MPKLNLVFVYSLLFKDVKDKFICDYFTWVSYLPYCHLYSSVGFSVSLTASLTVTLSCST